MRYKLKQWKRKSIAALAAAMVLAGTAVSAVPVYAADKSALQELVFQAEQMDVSSYTDESAALLQSALNSSVQVVHDDDAGSLRIRNHVTLLNTVLGALMKNTNTNMLISGNYTIEGILRQASSDNVSMGNAAINQPMEIIAEDDALTLRLHFSALTVPGLGQGYLSDLTYLPGWDGMLSDMTDAQYQAFQACTAESYYEGVYDVFNDPNTGTDASIRGRLYPEYLTMPVDYKDAEIWTKVYVPIMESISAGSGMQYARLQLDWNTLTWTDPDKSVLDTAVKQLEQLKENVIAADYTQEMADLLEQAVIVGTYIQNSTNVGQSYVDAMTQALNSVANLFADAEKQYLYDMIQLAGNYITGDYTDTYVADLKERIRAAQEVYNNVFATQTQVNEQYALLLQAISNAQKKESAPVQIITPTPETEKTELPTESGNGKLDKNNLKDGVYAVTGTMVKMDKRTASMSNDAINHTVKLTVKKGKYKITLDFMGLNVSGRYGYLSRLKYYKTGYTLDGYGAPLGTVKDVTVDSYQLDSSGARISDLYGTDYPNQVTFPLISEGVKDGYAPLQIYVPIMEAISAGTGTQSAFLFLDWDTLKAATDDDDNFKDNQSADSGGTLPAVNALTNGTSSLTGNAAGSLSGNSASKLLNADIGLSEFAELSSGIIPEEMIQKETADKETQVVPADAASFKSSSDSSNPAAMPTVMSVLMAGVGLLFKLKSRGGL